MRREDAKSRLLFEHRASCKAGVKMKSARQQRCAGTLDIVEA
jgi:hypothetical protein